jgi:hypothetical protein
MRKLDARLERIAAHVERIDARLCRMERGGPSRAPPAGDAPEPLWVAVRPPATRLVDLPAELLVAIAAQLAEDDELATAMACRKLRKAVAGTKRHTAGARLSTRIGSAFCSVGKLAWAVLSGGLPLSDGLLPRAARAGRLEQLSWLRARLRLGAGLGTWRGLLLERGWGRASNGAAVGARRWLPVGQIHVL